MRADCTACSQCYPASADGFSKYSGTDVGVDATARYSPSVFFEPRTLNYAENQAIAKLYFKDQSLSKMNK